MFQHVLAKQWFCNDGTQLIEAEKKTQSVEAAAVFSQQKKNKARPSSWLQQIEFQLCTESLEHSGRPLKQIPADITKKIREQVSTAIAPALNGTANQSIDLNISMAKRLYKYPAAGHDQLRWAAMHDERLVLSLRDPDIPAEFREDVRDLCEARGWVKKASHAGEHDFAEFATSENLCGEMTYACANCGVSA